jgi:hypothetical protein
MRTSRVFVCLIMSTLVLSGCSTNEPSSVSSGHRRAAADLLAAKYQWLSQVQYVNMNDSFPSQVPYAVPLGVPGPGDFSYLLAIHYLEQYKASNVLDVKKTDQIILELRSIAGAVIHLKYTTRKELAALERSVIQVDRFFRIGQKSWNEFSLSLETYQGALWERSGSYWLQEPVNVARGVNAKDLQLSAKWLSKASDQSAHASELFTAEIEDLQSLETATVPQMEGCNSHPSGLDCLRIDALNNFFSTADGGLYVNRFSIS